MAEYGWLDYILNPTPLSQKQKAIISAAVGLFSEKGYAATSTKEIAVRAGAAEGTIFKQFPTKKDLMLWLTARIINNALFPLVSVRITELLKKPFGSAEEFLAALFTNLMESMREGIPLFKIVIQEMPFEPKIRAMLVTQIKKLPLKDVAEKLRALDRGTEQIKFSEGDIIRILITCIAGFFVLRNIVAPELFADVRPKKDLAAFIKFISRGITGSVESI
ncbi:MAG: TetR/AcrR family transcriptional regulator [Treponema sp.]|nr:TetR/AcrR family transcriptional regulator [Treponema sp.]